MLRNLPEHFPFEVSNPLSCLVPGSEKTEKLDQGGTYGYMDRRPFPYETRLKIGQDWPLRRHPVYPFVPRWERFYESICDRNYF